MKTIESWKSSGGMSIDVYGGHLETVETESLTLRFCSTVPNLYDMKADWPGDATRAAYQKEARRLVGAMESHLPGGLMDALLAVLCERRASLLIVAETRGKS